MTRGKMIFAVLVLFAILISIDIYVETNYPILMKIDLQNPKLPAGSTLKILQISDLHDKSFGDQESRLLELVGGSDPDIIAITGDLADHTTRDFSNILMLVSNLKTLTPDIYYVPGNHEQSGTVMKKLFEGLSRLGVNVLMDSASVYTNGRVKVNVCGINYPFKETSYASGPAAEKRALAKALRGVDTSSYTILLSHSPRIVNSISGKPFDLILSGHTHGGQVRLPLIGNIFMINPDAFGEYDKGLYKLDNDSELYVDSGLGTSILPVRFDDRAQATLLTISGR